MTQANCAGGTLRRDNLGGWCLAGRGMRSYSDIVDDIDDMDVAGYY
jgi:hypothetical protein